jgi:hypothetical protein
MMALIEPNINCFFTLGRTFVKKMQAYLDLRVICIGLKRPLSNAYARGCSAVFVVKADIWRLPMSGSP